MKRWLTLLIAGALLLTMACSLVSRGQPPKEEPTTEVTSAPGNQPAATPTKASQAEATTEATTAPEEPGAPVIDSEGLKELQSYRSKVVVHQTNADGATEEMTIEIAATRDPAAQHMTITSKDGAIEIIQIGDQIWMRFGDEWIQTTSDEETDIENEFGSFLTEDWAMGLDQDPDNYTFVGKETVNDLHTRHYQTKITSAMADLMQLTNEDENTTFEGGTADVWVADEDNLPHFVVRSVVTLKSKVDGAEETVNWTQDVFDVNAEFVIEPPESGPAGGLPEGVPSYPGATDMSSMGTITAFTAPDDIKTVNAFYEDALKSAGWSKGEGSIETEDMVTSSWTKGDQSLTLTLSPNDDGTTSVMFMMEGGE